MAPVEPMRVLLATDDSEGARNAESWIVRARWAAPPTVDVLCVAGLGLTRFGWGIQTYRTAVREAIDGLRQSEVLAAERIANEVSLRLQRAGFVTRSWARQGDAAEEILASLESNPVDLVAIGPRGRSGLAAAILGSVTHELVAHASTAVLVGRSPRTAEGRLPEHALVVVHDTSSAAAALAWLDGAGWLAGERATLLGLLGDRAGLEKGPPGRIDELAQLVSADATETLGRLAQPLGASDVSLALILRGGHPLQATMDAIAELGVDLVVVARSVAPPGRDSFAEKIARHSSASVLLVASS